MPSERVQRRVDALLDDADAALAQRDWQSAAEICHAVLVMDPENEDAQSFLAAAQRALAERGGESTVSPVDQSREVAADVDSVDQPTSFVNGRYEVSRLLGEGGKKKVYLAHDTTLDRDVAFALIKTEGLDDEARQRITREAQAMARLGDNPNIMPIFDLGEDDGRPYLVMPVMGGGDVETLIAEAEVGRLSLEIALRITSDTCRGLDFAHSKGIIHRDLKPSNIWLTDDGTVRIGDFGLAISLDRARITQDQMIVGTVSYMPPEQATGGDITPRSDLYSLGAMLYEMVTGRPPFLGDDEIAIIGQHINTPPVAPSWHNKSLPQTLDSLIMRLLAKDPAERPESAADVLRALEAIDPAESTAAREDEEGSLDSMAGGVFVGRHREMDQLKAAFEETLGGHGKMVALVGEPGIGKTRTAQELATYAGMRGAQVLWGRCYEAGGAPPYWPWVQAIRSYVLERDTATIRREMGSTASVIAEVVPDVKERLPDLQPPPEIDDPDSARFRLFDSISTFLKTASNVQPIVLMLEDLHWSDKPSLLLLEFVVRELSNSRLMIVGNYRDMELNRRHPLSLTLGELTREHLFDRVLLRGLQKHDVRRFIEVAAGIDPPDALVDVVHTQTEGNPLFVSETVRLLIQEGDITSGAQARSGTSSWEVRIPEGVREVIGRRFDRLSERCNEVLTIAAVMGRQFRFGVLMKLVEDVSENRLLDVLEEALDARIVEEEPSEVGLYQFTHALMRETLTSELTLTRRVRLHARIAESLEEIYGNDADEHAVELVEHFIGAEAVIGTEKLVQYSIVAGEQALALSAPQQALDYFERALASSDDDEMNDQQARLLLGGALAEGSLASVGILRDAGEAGVVKAFDYYVAEHNLEMIESIALAWVFRLGDTAIYLMETALRYLDAESAAAGRLYTRLAWAKVNMAKFAEAKADLERASAISDKLVDSQLDLDVLFTQVRVDTTRFTRPELLKMLDDLDRVQELAHSNSDSIIGLVAHNFSAVTCMRLGRPKDALAHAQSAYEVASPIGYRHGATFAAANAFHANLAVGDWEEVEPWLGREEKESDYGSRGIQGRRLLFRSLRHRLDDDELVHNALDSLDVLDRDVWQGLALIGEACSATPELLPRDVLDPIREEAMNYHDLWGAGPITGAVGAMGAGMMAVVFKDADAAQRPYDALNTINTLEAGLSTDRVAGSLAILLNDFDSAETHFESALKFCRDHGCIKELTATCFDYTEMLLERNASGDREKAIEIRDEGITVAIELGMAPLVGRFVELSARLTVDESSASNSATSKSSSRGEARSGVIDELTGLGDWSLFRTSLEVEQLLADGPEKFSAAVKINLDGFRHINDSHGIAAGDDLLRKIAETLRLKLPATAMPCRIGADEFCFVLRGVDTESALTKIADTLKSILETYVSTADERVHVSGTAGIVMLPTTDANPDQIAVLLDESIRIARRSGRNSIHIYQPGEQTGSSAATVQRSTASILDALANDRFQLFRQPIVSVTTRALGHYEVLIRMVNEDGSLRSPIEFIPQAESLNLIQQIDRWVIEHTMQLWKSRHDAGEDLHLAINVSGMSVGKDIAEYLREQADLNGVPHDAITVEITETAAMHEDSLAGEMAEALHTDGFKLAIDDFGSGATSLAKVRELKFEYLKLDGILVKNLAESESDREFVSALAKLAHDVGVEIIAEFVQDEATMEFLAECEIEYAQGYYIGEPEPFPG